MKKTKLTKIAILSFLLFALSSCYTYKTSFVGNIHQNAIGKSKNEILRTYGVPERITDDGANGSVLVYEQQSQTTISNAGGYSYGRSASVGGAIYNNGGMIGAQQTRSGQVSAMSGVSQTFNNKTFCYLYLNPEGIVYDFKSNYGAQFQDYRCFSKVKTWLFVGLTCVGVYPAVISIPVAIILQRKAKKNGEICK